MLSEHREIPPGPAFIQKRGWTDPLTDQEAYWIGSGYVWMSGTESQAAGWVRPHASAAVDCGGTRYPVICNVERPE